MTTLIATAAQGAGQFLAESGLRESLIRIGAAYAGGAVERLLSPARRVEGPRIDSLRVTQTEEGAPILTLFGRVRAAGQLIWAARLKERASSDRPAGKGGPRVTNYRYSLSFAIGLGEGEIARIGRVWANGAPLSLAGLTYRLYRGTSDQPPDPLIEAIEGTDSTPAYRGLGYIVFEDFPLDAYGDRLPNLEFEIVRPVPAQPRAPTGPDEAEPLEAAITAINLIPGAGEFTLAPDPVLETLGPGRQRALNLAADPMQSDFAVSIAQLAAELPQCRHVNLILGWFGDDLRAGQCRVRPGVETRGRTTPAAEWRVAGRDRASAYLISQKDGRANYGGTPDDRSVVAAIRHLKAQGFTVGLYPFLFMDIPAGSGRADPYGGAEQAAFPWRGRITGAIAPGRSGATDLSPAAAAEIAAFFGAARAQDYRVAGEGVVYSGPAEDSWSRMVLHYAALAALAGGVDFFLIGSEFRGLSQLRAALGDYPAVAALRRLAGEARRLLGPAAKITYAADWSEYFGHQPADGSGEIRFHLDPLWADPSIDYVGIDYYPPLGDWRDSPGHADSGYGSIYDPRYIAANIEGGEGYDWYYAGPADRAGQIRTPITDGRARKPYVFRPKDLRNFWGQLHVDRPNGVEAAQPTAWRPGMKPIVLCEFGVPAVDKGVNAPNLFFDPKSAESAAPPFSTGERDDLIQRRALETVIDYWRKPEHSPPSPIDGRAMIDWTYCAVWAWDARPFPEFPARADLWGDAENWARGHWLNGRTGLAPLENAVACLARAAGVELRQSGLAGIIAGYAVPGGRPLAEALAPLTLAYDLLLAEKAGALELRSAAASAVPVTLTGAEILAPDEGQASLEAFALARADPNDRPDMVAIRYLSPALDAQPRIAAALPEAGKARRVLELEAPLALDPGQARAIAARALADARAGGDQVEGRLGPEWLGLELGDIAFFPEFSGLYRLERLEGDWTRRFRARLLAPRPSSAMLFAPAPEPALSAPLAPARPVFALLDLAWPGPAEDDLRPFAGLFAEPWPGEAILSDPGATNALVSVRNPATLGELFAPLRAGPVGRWDEANGLTVKLYGGALSAQTRAAVLAGANRAAVETAKGWEILQFAAAEAIAPAVYAASSLLRGCFGSAADMVDEIPAGARFVLLDSAILRPDFTLAERFAPKTLAALAPSQAMADAFTADFVYEARASRPLAPVRLRARRAAEGVWLGWIRQGRIGAENLDAPDIPLGEAFERYQIEILTTDGAVRRTLFADQPQMLYAAGDEIADFGGPQPAIAIRVAQYSAVWGPGLAAQARLVTPV